MCMLRSSDADPHPTGAGSGWKVFATLDGRLHTLFGWLYGPKGESNHFGMAYDRERWYTRNPGDEPGCEAGFCVFKTKAAANSFVEPYRYDVVVPVRWRGLVGRSKRPNRSYLVVDQLYILPNVL